jgi:signal transduction histidine kinase
MMEYKICSLVQSDIVTGCLSGPLTSSAFHAVLDNAVKFTKTGGVALIVEERPGPTEDSRTVRFSCLDTGIGIPHQKLKVLFREFTQVDMRFSREVRLAVRH